MRFRGVAVPDRPKALELVMVTDGAIDVKWEAVSSETHKVMGYRIAKNVPPRDDYETVASYKAGVQWGWCLLSGSCV